RQQGPAKGPAQPDAPEEAGSSSVLLRHWQLYEVPTSLPLPTSPTYLLGYRVAMIWLRAEAPSTSHSLLLPYTYHLTPSSGTPPLLPIPLPTPSPPLLPPFTDPRADVREVCLLPQKRPCYTFGSRFEAGESLSAPTVRPAEDSRLDYGYIATLDDEIMRDPASDGLMASRLNLLVRDRRLYAHIVLLMEKEARISQEAWGRAMDACDFVCFENIALRTQVVAQRLEIIELRATDRRRQAQFAKALRLVVRLQTQITEFERQQGPAKGPAQPDAPEEAGSSS
nr:hypothetical protein [Tanacetum cinerariifolium]